MNRVLSTLLAFTAISAAASVPSLRIYSEIAPPLQIQGPDGTLCGIGIDLVRAIQNRVGNTAPIQIVPWARGYGAAVSDPNVVLFAVARTPERVPLFHWIGPIDEMIYYLWVQAGSAISLRTLEDAKRLKGIGVYRNDVRDQLLTRAGFTNLDRANDNVTNLRKLLVGHLEAFAASGGEINDLVRAAGCKRSDLKAALPFFRARLFIVISKGTPAATVMAWSSAFAALTRDQTFPRIYWKYKPGQPLPGSASTEL